MTVEEAACSFFQAVPRVPAKYLPLDRLQPRRPSTTSMIGQQANDPLRPAEAQRVKLAKELSQARPPAARSPISWTTDHGACTSPRRSEAAGGLLHELVSQGTRSS